MHASAKANEGVGGNIRCRLPFDLVAKGAAAWLFAVGLAVASGCRDGERLEVPAIEVNGIALTGGEVDREIAFRLALVKFHKPKMSDAGPLRRARKAATPPRRSKRPRTPCPPSTTRRTTISW